MGYFYNFLTSLQLGNLFKNIVSNLDSQNVARFDPETRNPKTVVGDPRLMWVQRAYKGIENAFLYLQEENLDSRGYVFETLNFLERILAFIPKSYEYPQRRSILYYVGDEILSVKKAAEAQGRKEEQLAALSEAAEIAYQNKQALPEAWLEIKSFSDWVNAVMNYFFGPIASPQRYVDGFNFLSFTLTQPDKFLPPMLTNKSHFLFFFKVVQDLSYNHQANFLLNQNSNFVSSMNRLMVQTNRSDADRKVAFPKQNPNFEALKKALHILIDFGNNPTSNGAIVQFFELFGFSLTEGLVSISRAKFEDGGDEQSSGGQTPPSGGSGPSGPLNSGDSSASKRASTEEPKASPFISPVKETSLLNAFAIPSSDIFNYLSAVVEKSSNWSPSGEAFYATWEEVTTPMEMYSSQFLLFLQEHNIFPEAYYYVLDYSYDTLETNQKRLQTQCLNLLLRVAFFFDTNQKENVQAEILALSSQRFNETFPFFKEYTTKYKNEGGDL